MSSVGALEFENSGPPAADSDLAVAEIAGHLNVQNSRLVHVMADVLENDGWVGTGVHTPTQWLAWKTGLSPERAAVIVKVAKQRASFPQVFAMFDRGAVSLEQVAVVVTRAPAWADGKVVNLIDELSVAQLRRTITDKFFDDGPEPARQPAHRSLIGCRSARLMMAVGGSAATSTLPRAAVSRRLSPRRKTRCSNVATTRRRGLMRWSRCQKHRSTPFSRIRAAIGIARGFTSM